MFDWLFEGRLMVYALLAGAVVILLALWFRDRRRWWLFGVGAVASLALLYFILDRTVETRREQIARKLNEMAAAVAKKDANAIFQHISEQFRVGQLDKARFRKAVTLVMNDGYVDDLRLWDFDFTDDAGKVTFKAKPRGKVPEKDGFFLIRGEFVRDTDGQWRLKEFQAFHPFIDTKSPLDIGPYLPADR